MLCKIWYLVAIQDFKPHFKLIPDKKIICWLIETKFKFLPDQLKSYHDFGKYPSSSHV